MQTLYRKICDACLAESDGDYVGLWEIAGSLEAGLGFGAGARTEIQARALWDGLCAVVTLLLQNGLAAVDLAAQGKCVPWPEQNPQAVIAEIARRYAANPKDRNAVEFGVWFDKAKHT